MGPFQSTREIIKIKLVINSFSENLMQQKLVDNNLKGTEGVDEIKY